MEEYKYVSVTTMRKALEAARKDFERVIEHLETVERLVAMFEEKHSPTRQILLGDIEKPTYVYDVEKWLVEVRNLKTMDEFEQWLKEKKPDTIRNLCYNATYRKLDILTIREIARSCLTPNIEVR